MIKSFENFLNETYYEDLTAFKYGVAYPECVNVGWLDEEHPFEEGDVPDGFIEKLKKLPVIMQHLGYHDCPFCGNSHSSNVKFVPGDGVNYLTPDMIIHYVEKHNYKPPQEFIDAVMNMGEMSSSQVHQILGKSMEKQRGDMSRMEYMKKLMVREKRDLKIFEEFGEFDKELFVDKVKNPDKYRTGNFYITPDGSKIESIDENGGIITGIIVDSPIKVQIGLINIFMRMELSKWRKPSDKNLEIDPFREEYW